MQEFQDNKQIFFRWSSYSRCFENRSQSFYKLLFILGLCFSLLAFFLGEYLLVLVIWSLIFVAWVSAIVPPPLIEHKISRFGIEVNSLFIPTKSLSAFTIVKKKNCYLLRLFISAPESEVFVVLPTEPDLRKNIVDYLQNQVPFLERVPKSEVEKIAEFLSRVTGLV